MRGLRKLTLAVFLPLVYSSPAGILKTAPFLDVSGGSPTLQDENATAEPASGVVPVNTTTIETTTDESQSISTPLLVTDPPSITTSVEVTIATVAVTATQTISVGEPTKSPESTGDIAASEASGSDQPVPAAVSGAEAVGSNDTLPLNPTPTVNITSEQPASSEGPIVAILGSNETSPHKPTDSDGPIVAILGGNGTDSGSLPSGVLPIIGGDIPDGSPPLIIGKRHEKRQFVAESEPNGDSITFQTHSGEGFVQPQVVPVFQQVVDTTTTDTTTSTTSTTTESTSSTLTSGTTTTTTTSTSSATDTATDTTTSTTTSWVPSYTTPTPTPGIAVITTWSTASTTTCIPAESHEDSPPLPTACTGTSTLCTITLAYVISQNPTTTSYYTTPFDSDDFTLAGTTATQTVYSEDPNGFHVYVTTQDDSDGDATATYYYTTPTPTARMGQAVNGGRKLVEGGWGVWSGLGVFWGIVIFTGL